MTREDIIRMGIEAGFVTAKHPPMMLDAIERFARIVAAAEREACAKVCDEVASHCWVNEDDGNASSCAKAIRARGRS